MNERIKKSYVQALAKCAKDLSKNGEDVDIPVDVFAEKFAELIVQECIHTVESHGGMGGAVAGDKIRKQFGVK